MVRITLSILLLCGCFSSYGEIIDETLTYLSSKANYKGSLGNASIDNSKFLSCESLELRLDKLRKYDSYFASLEEQARFLDNRQFQLNLNEYLFNHLDDTYLNLFEENNLIVEMPIKLNKDKIYFVLIGGEVRLYFPRGAQDIDIFTKSYFTTSNFNVCRSDNMVLYEVSGCDAQNLLDLKSCHSLYVESFKLKSPRKKLGHNADIVIGGSL